MEAKLREASDEVRSCRFKLKVCEDMEREHNRRDSDNNSYRKQIRRMEHSHLKLASKAGALTQTQRENRKLHMEVVRGNTFIHVMCVCS